MGNHDVALLYISTTHKCNKLIRQKVMFFNKADLSSLWYDCRIFASNFLLQSFPDVNPCWTVFRNNVIPLVKNYIPNQITRSRKTNAWMNTETGRMVLRKNGAFTKAQFMKSPMTLKDTSISNQNVNELFGKLLIYAFKTLFAIIQEKVIKNLVIIEKQKTGCFQRCSCV